MGGGKQVVCWGCKPVSRLRRFCDYRLVVTNVSSIVELL
jgi:hypothetical protein